MHGPMPNAQRAICNVLAELFEETHGALAAARQRIDAVSQSTAEYEEHLNKIIVDVAKRNAGIHTFAEKVSELGMVAQRATFAAPLQPPVPPPDLAAELAAVDALAVLRADGTLPERDPAALAQEERFPSLAMHEMAAPGQRASGAPG